MPLVKLLVSRVTSYTSQSIGQVLEVSPEEAQRLVTAGHAEIVHDKPETATAGESRAKAVKK